MGISDLIAGRILEILEDEGGCAELQRAELAQRFGCVPSQINYVISTRFSPEHGYVVESRRGGNGYIRITRIRLDKAQMLMHTIGAIGDNLDRATARAYLSNLLGAGAIDQHSANLMAAAVSDHALRGIPADFCGHIRATILKQMLITIVKEEG